MRYRFKYAYYDLGELQEGETVVVRLNRPGANVILLDPANFDRYRGGASFRFYRGSRSHSEVKLPVPSDGHWYLAMDLGGRPGRTTGAVKVIGADGSRRELGMTRATESAAA